MTARIMFQKLKTRTVGPMPIRFADVTADDRADDAEHNVRQHAGPGLVDDLARDEPGDQAQNDPGDYCPHVITSPCAASRRGNLRYGREKRKPVVLAP